MRKSKCVLIFVLLAVVFSMLIQQGKALLQEYYNTGDTTTATFYGSLWVAQTFTPEPLGYNIIYVRLKMYRVGSPGTLTVSIRATSGGLPTGSDLTSGTIDGNTFTTSSGGAWYRINLTSYALSGSTQYAIVARATSGDGTNYVRWRMDISSTYSGGTYCSSSDSGSSWSSNSAYDLMFETYSDAQYLYNFYGVYDEASGELQSASERAVNVTAYHADGTSSSTFEVNGTQEYYAVTQPSYFVFNLTTQREYWLSSGENNTDIYIFDDSLTSYVIEFVDLAGVLDDYPFVEAQRYINGTLFTVEKRRVDEERKVQMSLVNGEKYSIIVQDGSSYTYGDILFTSTTTITLTLKGIEFPDEVILAFRYVRLYAQRHNNYTSISMLYEDLDQNTNNVNCTIRYRNSTIAYTTVQTADSFNVTWTSAVYNITYIVEMTADHGDYGQLNYRAMMYRGGWNVAPWGLDWLGNIPDMVTSSLLPIFIIFAVAGTFSKVNAYMGAFLAWGMAALFAWWGWLTVPPEMLIAALVFAILLAYAYKKKRVVGG